MKFKCKQMQREYLTVSRTLCDLCKEAIGNPNHGCGESSEVTIEAKLGDIWPEGDARTHVEIDCCEECFSSKVRPLIESTFGVKFRERDADDFSYRDLAWDPDLPNAERK